MVGASMWHGPHQSAQQSTSAGVGARVTTLSKVSSVTATGVAAADGSGALHFPQRPWSAARASGTRFIAPHDGHFTSSMRSSVTR